MPITRAILPRATMFRRTPTKEVNGNLVFGLMQPVVQPQDGDKLITVNQSMENRLDLIASRFIGDPNYWWTIAQVNGMIDPLTECYTSALLRVPDRSTLS